MSRIGMKLINIPENVEINIGKNNNISVKGPKGNLTNTFSDEINGFFCFVFVIVIVKIILLLLHEIMMKKNQNLFMD